MVDFEKIEERLKTQKQRTDNWIKKSFFRQLFSRNKVTNQEVINTFNECFNDKLLSILENEQNTESNNKILALFVAYRNYLPLSNYIDYLEKLENLSSITPKIKRQLVQLRGFAIEKQNNIKFQEDLLGL